MGRICIIQKLKCYTKITTVAAYCRLKVAPDELAHALPLLLPKKGSPEAEALERAEEISRELGLPTEELQRLRLRQQSNARIFERQKSRVHH